MPSGQLANLMVPFLQHSARNDYAGNDLHPKHLSLWFSEYRGSEAPARALSNSTSEELFVSFHSILFSTLPTLRSPEFASDSASLDRSKGPESFTIAMASAQPQMYGQPSSDPAAELQRQMATAAAQQAAQQGAQVASQKAKHGFYEIKVGKGGNGAIFSRTF